MRTNTIKRKLAAGQPVIGSWLALGDVTAARVMARAGFEFLCLDLEHISAHSKDAESIFALVADAGCVPLCRVPDGTTENIKKALDSGAWGIIAPMVESVAQAQAIIDATFYPPRGRRGVGPGTHYLSFGASDAEYKARANEEILCVLMIESPAGLACAPAICALEGVDAVLVGPADLRAQLTRTLPGGRPPTEAEFEGALAQALAAGAAAGTPVGLHTFSLEECAARAAGGFRLLFSGTDAGLLGAAAGAAVAALGVARGDTFAAAAGGAGSAAMRTNTIKRKLAAGQPVIGSWLNLGDITTARVMARAGWEYLCLDMEHTAVNWKDAEIIFGLVASAGCVPLCRVPDGTVENIKKALDAGAWGIVAPMVDTVAQAQVIIDACYYPPRGRRSVGSGTHYLSFGTADAEYKARANEEILCVLMTESPEGVANAPAIYALEGVDAVFVGPNDLRAQFTRTLPGGRRPTEAEFEGALARVLAAGAGAGTPVGLHTFSVEECAARVAGGFRFMAMGSDAGLLGAAAGAAVAALGVARGDTGAAGGAGAVGGAAKY